jgi:hypothetical protein
MIVMTEVKPGQSWKHKSNCKVFVVKNVYAGRATGELDGVRYTVHIGPLLDNYELLPKQD